MRRPGCAGFGTASPAMDAVTQEPPIRPTGAVSNPGPDTTNPDEPRLRASDLLVGFLEDGRTEPVTLGDLVRVFGHRAFGMMLLILAIPNVVPVPGLSTVVGVPTVLLGLQMAAGWRQPWLPRKLAGVAFGRDHFRAMIRHVLPRIESVERRLRPRYPRLTDPLAERLLGLVIAFLGAILCLPIVFGNLPPAIAIGLMALGMIEKDGGFVVAGLVASVVALLIVAGVLLGLGGAVYFVFERAFG